jgi:hypothetical protein
MTLVTVFAVVFEAHVCYPWKLWPRQGERTEIKDVAEARCKLYYPLATVHMKTHNLL